MCLALHSQRRFGTALAVTAGLAAACALAAAPVAARAQGDVPLPLTLPKPAFAGTPKDLPSGANIEKPSGHPRPVPTVPKGTVNLALHKKVTASKAPFSGSLDQITDGIKDAKEGTAVEIKPGLQWVQIDLGAPDKLFYVVVWHYHMEPVVFHDVIVQLSNDPNFVDGVTTIYNNDVENKAGLGIGHDREYFETNEGRLIDAKGTTARYVRLYSRGSTFRDPLNRYTEVEVYGLPSNATASAH